MGAGFNLSVTVRIGSLSTTNLNTTYQYAIPVIFGLVYSQAPTTGLINVGGSISPALLPINGVNFGLATSNIVVIVGTQASALVNWLSGGQLRCSIPAGAGTNLFVSVIVDGQANAPTGLASFSYDPPVIETVSISGSFNTTGGAIISINGTNFGPPSLSVSVFLASLPCASILHFSHTNIQCTSPAGAGHNLLISVNVAGQVSSTQTGSISSSFSYNPPVILSLGGSYHNASATGGSVITVQGYNFGPSSTLQVVPVNGNALSTNWYDSFFYSFFLVSSAFLFTCSCCSLYHPSTC